MKRKIGAIFLPRNIWGNFICYFPLTCLLLASCSPVSDPLLGTGQPCDDVEVSISPSVLTLHEGRRENVHLQGGFGSCRINWDSSDERVVEFGVPAPDQSTISVLASGPGSATISAWLGYGPQFNQARCAVRVLPVSIDSMGISPDPVNVSPGENRFLRATIVDGAGFELRRS